MGKSKPPSKFQMSIFDEIENGHLASLPPGDTTPDMNGQDILRDAVGGYDTAKATGMLAFAAEVKRTGHRSEIETEGNLDILKASRLCNAILRGVASSRPAPTPERWEQATGFVADFFAVENVQGKEWLPVENRKPSPVTGEETAL